MRGYMDMLDSRIELPKKHIFTVKAVPFMNRLIPDSSSVLDYGCGNGSLGFLGYDKTRSITVEGYDCDLNNAKAKYHDLKEIDRKFDYIVLAQMIEHCSLEDAISVIEWCAAHCDNLIISTPNAFDNVFINFYKDITHVRPFNTPDLVYILKKNGFQKSDIYLTDMALNPFRILFALLTWTSPFHNYMVHASKGR